MKIRRDKQIASDPGTMQQDFSKESLERVTAGRLIGSRIHFFETIDSTNSYADILATHGACEGEVVVADRQTAGRGRLKGRVWHSPPARNLYTSVILRPPIPPASATGLVFVAGVAVAELLNAHCPVSLKWPNDVLAGGRKISGILTEMRSKGSEVEFVVVGIGINVNMEPDDFQEDLRSLSTSLKAETSREVSRLELTAGLYRLLEQWYRIFLRDGLAPVRDRWLECSGMAGRMVEVTDGALRHRGRCQGIDDEGVLLLLDEHQKNISIRFGDVTIQKDG